jgi:hypothetical protein
MCIFNLGNKLSSGYRNVKYHNKVHAFDVTQVFLFIYILEAIFIKLFFKKRL